MEAFRFFTILLIAFGIAGTHCLRHDPVASRNHQLLDETFNEYNELVRGTDNFHQIDQHQGAETLNKRVVRYTPNENSFDGPSQEQLQRARERQQRQRAQSERAEHIRQATSDRLRQEEERRLAGEREMAKRIKDIKRNRPIKSR